MNFYLNVENFLPDLVSFLYLFYCFAMNLSLVLCSHNSHTIDIKVESYNRNNRFRVKNAFEE